MVPHTFEARSVNTYETTKNQPSNSEIICLLISEGWNCWNYNNNKNSIIVVVQLTTINSIVIVVRISFFTPLQTK